MATELKRLIGDNKISFFFEPSASTVGTTAETLCEIESKGFSRLGFTVKNTGSAAFTAFTIQVKCSPNDEYTTLFSLAADFTSPVCDMLKASASPVTLGAGSSVVVGMDISTWYAVKVTATCGTSTTATIKGFAQ